MHANITLTPGTIESIVVSIALREYVKDRKTRLAKGEILKTVDAAGLRAAEVMLDGSMREPMFETRYCNKCGARYDLSLPIMHDNHLCYDCTEKEG